MKKCESNLLFLALGAAVGTAVGYAIGSEKTEEWIENFKKLANKVRRKGDQVLDELTNDED